MKKSLFYLLLITLLAACSQEEEAPRVDSVWINMVSRPIEQVTCAYPGQTLCLRGDHLGEVRRLFVNRTEINLNSLYIYQSDEAITFQLPSDVRTSGDLIRVVTRWGMTDHTFIIRPKSEQPEISSFSSTTLVAGRTLTITGKNLDGATEVWLPTTFGGRAKCELDGEQDSTGISLTVIIPTDATFASGMCEVVMQKHDSERGIDYTEKAFSETTNFKN
ncbi:MAG: IPT/TIG domain-containing protein [Prevotella sp.]|nr:IPT/TIG domain-containing protein [Prevotella sp.]